MLADSPGVDDVSNFPLQSVAPLSLRCYEYVASEALVVKWISYRSPEPGVWVRFPARALQLFTKTTDERI
jgi:hypothetical protein